MRFIAIQDEEPGHRNAKNPQTRVCGSRGRRHTPRLAVTIPHIMKLDDFDAILLDMDGTLYREHHALPTGA